ncbi:MULTISPECIES: cupin domain-containing protein [Clostridium]|uniref:Cupin domain-containing protein n=1 Tax=Clostridium frigoriphilum TaxID=443253 RepID=A0ABU7UMR4_9CLOT|nr:MULTISPECIES: cupin domain-containing protein [Clostridium]MBU3099500.1 cupin domain-containing protein [Clostridium sp. DSM 17811]MBX4267888.1 cupin domain-containing protein [Clostridium estertheticum]WLC78119.1 cupin domain-containing protein [Clostridium estertheticum]
MKKVDFNEVKPYKAPKHFDCTTLKLQGKAETGATKFWMGLTHFLPAGGSEYDYEDSPTEKVYMILEGQLTVTSKTETFVLNKWDTLFIPPFEGRKITNNTNMPVTILVVVNN